MVDNGRKQKKEIFKAVTKFSILREIRENIRRNRMLYKKKSFEKIKSYWN